MGPQDRPGGWGRLPDDPFLRQLYRDPKRAARVHMAFTIGMAMFWVLLLTGLLLFFYFLIFGAP